METFFSPAKINLRLKVLGRRDDGYHSLSMLNAMLTLGDDVSLALNDAGSVTVDVIGTYPEDLVEPLHDPEVNLAARAASLVLKTAAVSCGVAINIGKWIPTGGGLGGGSSNAACVLLNLPDLLHREGHISEARRKKLSKQLLKACVTLGADVPYFMKVQETVSHVAGIGELVRPVVVDDLFGIRVFLVVPNFGVSTPAVYAELRKQPFDEEACVAQELRVLDSIDERHPYSWLVQRLENDLVSSTQLVAPEMKRLFALGNKVSDVVFMQSGSGSAFFALPKSIDFDELAIENALKEKFSGKNVEIIKTNLLAKPDY